MIFRTNSFSDADFFLMIGLLSRNRNWKKCYGRSDFASPVLKRCFSDVWESEMVWSRLGNCKRSYHWSSRI